MTKNEKAIYKSGRKNENGYPRFQFTKKQKKLVAYTIFIVIFGIIVYALDFSGVTAISEIKNVFGAIDGVKPVDSDFAVYYLDVGQSDCTIVVCDDEVLMIDCGTYNQLNTIRQSIHTLDINKIDYMVVTHQHDDHMGSAIDLLEDLTVENFIMPKLAQSNNVTSKTYNVLINTLDGKNINKIPAQDCKSFMLGEALVEILSPTVQSNNLNNMSVVLKVTYGDTEFLFQGDAESKIENDLLRSDYDIDVDVLKTGHHGSKTSSSDKYIEATSPEIAIISSGYGNNYGHPNATVLERLEKEGISTFTTLLYGDIAVASDGETITVYTQNSREVLQYK
ncbi:MAG: MBL fold metallo-hydrolase [Ruminococcaceae bacterium]|nr:MBL fold metallo-hydrolase [Oscillospiraceae bacterium]